MKQFRLFLSAFLSVFSLALFASSAFAGTVGALRICQSCAGSGDLSRYDYVVLHSDQAALIPTIKAKNPAAKVLVYKNAVATYAWAQSNGADWAKLPSGVGYVYANSSQQSWFLKDKSGQRIAFSDYSSMWLMDFGNTEYQQAWLANVLADVKANGWDGVMIDDVNANQRFHLGGRTIAKYPGYSDQQEAMRKFLAAVGPGLTSQGVLAMPNIFVEWPSGPSIWSQWIGYTSGALQEYWTKWGEGSSQHFTGSDWSYRQDFLKLTQQAGKIYLGVTYAPSTDARSMAYARGSFLLEWNGGKSALLYEPGATDPWNEGWTVELGTPSGAKFAVGSAWRRNYSGGTVVVNPSSGSQTVQLGGSFVNAEGATVTSVTLAPATAAVLKPAPTATTGTTGSTPAPGTTTGTGTGGTSTPEPTADKTAPTLNITSPAHLARVPSSFTVTATASDAVGVTKVVFLLDGATICTDTAAAFSCTMRASSGGHWVIARAFDAAGNVAESTIKVKI